MKAILLKVDSAVHKQWSERAAREHLTLSEFIRASVNTSLRTEKKIAKPAVDDGRRAQGSALGRRRTALATDRSARKTIKYLDQGGNVIDETSMQDLVQRSYTAPAHDPTCTCGVCKFKREHLKK